MNLKMTMLLVGVISISGLLVGCGSSSNETEALTQQRARQSAADNALPAPAQGRIAQQNQQKQQMDAMRAADANKTR